MHDYFFSSDLFLHLTCFFLGAAKTPSTAFCLLLRLCTIRCSEKQMRLMLNHGDSPYIRCIGFLYLRFTSDPSRIWNWFEPYLYDNESVRVHSNQNKPGMTIGEYVRLLVTDMDYYGTLLPRLPLVLEREMKVKLLQVEQIERRCQSHLNDNVCMNYFQKVGSRVRAMYGDDENPVAWYDAVIDSVITDDNDGNTDYNVPKFVVTFPEYGNTEVVMLGEIDMPRRHTAPDSGNHISDNIDKTHYYHHGNKVFDYRDNRLLDDLRKSDKAWSSINLEGKHHIGKKSDNDFIGRRSIEYYRFNHSYGYRHKKGNVQTRHQKRDVIISTPSSRFNDSSLMEEVLRREREKCAAKGKAYASRPATFKESIAITEKVVKQSHIQPSLMKDEKFRGSRQRDIKLSDAYSKSTFNQPPLSTFHKRKTDEELAALEEKKRKLIERYG